jgi:hypothetical protein
VDPAAEPDHVVPGPLAELNPAVRARPTATSPRWRNLRRLGLDEAVDEQVMGVFRQYEANWQHTSRAEDHSGR